MIVNGKFTEKIVDNFNPSKNIETYLFSLLNQALSFINIHCLDGPVEGECLSNYVSEDMLEWRIKFRKENHNISAIELIHQRDSNGLNYTYNIVYGK